MRRANELSWVCALVIAVSACDRPAPQAPRPSAPSAELTQRAVLALLPGLQFGPDSARDAYREIHAVDVAGSHFVPGADRWIVHYCVEFANFASDTPLRRCDINVEVYALDTKKWIGFARGSGTLYRWQVLEDVKAPGDSQPAAAAPGRDAKRPAP